MKIYTRTEAGRMLKRVFKTGEIEPRRKVSPITLMSDAQLLDKLHNTKDNRTAQRISREIARRLVLARYESSSQ
jgi:hypothetical protein